MHAVYGKRSGVRSSTAGSKHSDEWKKMRSKEGGRFWRSRRGVTLSALGRSGHPAMSRAPTKPCAPDIRVHVLFNPSLRTANFYRTTLGDADCARRATVSRTQLQAMLRSIALLLPSILLSGFFIECELMPQIMQWLGLLLPLTYFLEILRGIIGRGAGIVELRVH
jgi:hypothetical protein